MFSVEVQFGKKIPVFKKKNGRYQQVLIHFSDSMNTIRIIFNAFFLHATHLFQPFKNVVSPLHHLTHGSSFYFWSETAGAMSIRIIVNQFLSLLNSQNFLSWWQLPLSILSHALGSRFTVHCEKSCKYHDTFFLKTQPQSFCIIKVKRWAQSNKVVIKENQKSWILPQGSIKSPKK